MKTDEIMQLPVEEIAADDAFLFIWATFPNLPEAFRVIDGWGSHIELRHLSGSKPTKRTASRSLALDTTPNPTPRYAFSQSGVDRR